jgi:hypothetical protein
MRDNPDLQTERGPIIWVEKTGDMKLRVCVAYGDPAPGFFLTVAEADWLIERLRAKQAEIAEFKS